MQYGAKRATATNIQKVQTVQTIQTVQTESSANWRWARRTGLVAGIVLSATVLGMAASAIAQFERYSSIQTLNAATPKPDADISAERQAAHRLFRSVTGVPLAIDDQRLDEIERLISSRQSRQAAEIVVQDPLFFDVQLRDMAKKMSTQDETVRAPLSDFVATFVGVARDNIDARELLRGNFIYQADPVMTIIDGQQRVRSGDNDLIGSNNHYDDISANQFSLFSVLKKVEGQRITDARVTNTLLSAIPHPEPAGLLTTRAFMEAHATAGTNRRIVEHAFRQFMCVSMEEWMDASRPDDMVGRDVDRFPGGAHDRYQATCKACHGQMDGMRQAFAFTEFVLNRTIVSPIVVPKMNRNSDVYPEGFVTTGNAWINYATEGKNGDQFGWRSATSGRGISEFGNMLAASRGFSRCLTRRMFTAVCGHAPSPARESVVRAMADEFEKTYRLRDLAVIVATSPACAMRQ